MGNILVLNKNICTSFLHGELAYMLDCLFLKNTAMSTSRINRMMSIAHGTVAIRTGVLVLLGVISCVGASVCIFSW